MADPLVSWEQARRFTLRRQHLSELAPPGSLLEVVADVCGLQSQVKLGPEMMLWSRLQGFRPDDLSLALLTKRTMVRLWLMRGTLHTITSADLPLFQRAMRRAWDDRWIRWMDEQVPRHERQALYPLILDLLQTPATRQEIERRVKERTGSERDRLAVIFGAWGGVLRELAGLGQVVQAESAGAQVRFARTDRWLPGVKLNRYNEHEALAGVFLRYLAGYGPATLQDFTYWTGLDAEAGHIARTAAGEAVSQVRIEGEHTPYLMRRQDLAELVATDPATPLPVRLLPRFDVLLLGYRAKQRFLAAEHAGQVFAAAGDVRATILFNGRVAGLWSAGRRKEGLTLQAQCFGRCPGLADQLRPEAERLAHWYGADVARLDVLEGA